MTDKLINVKTSLILTLIETLNNKLTIIDPDVLYLSHINKNNTDYISPLIKLHQFLKSENIILTCEELYNILITSLNPGQYTTRFDRNSLNINLTSEYITFLMKPFLTNNVIELTPSKQNILVDFSSPNIAKDMHVGHLRSTIIGDSICKLYELQGHIVHRINHIGDFGLQFGMIIQHLLEKYPDYNNCSFTIADLQTFYAESKKRFDNEPEFKKSAYEKVVELQSGNADIVNAWNFIKHISQLSYNEIYDELGINLTECGESFYQPQIPLLIGELHEKGLLIEENGRKIIKVDGFELPLTVVKTDGGFTYDTTDLAAVRYRLVDLNMDKIIYVVDEGQSLHFELIFKIAEVAGWKKGYQELKHVGFGLVCGSDGKKFKSRSGDTVKLKDLLNDSITKSKEVFEDLQKSKKTPNTDMSDSEKNNIIKTVAYASIKYADLSTIRTNNYQFSLDKMVSLKGNTGVYQLYEYVRTCAIIRNAGDYANNIDPTNFTLTEKEEINVCKQLLIFPEIIEHVSETLMFNNLCTYLYNLTSTFSTFHKKCRCLHFKDGELIGVDENKLLLCFATKYVMEKCFHILGINTLERM
jgi:arginyl-tRNA synthetase